MKNLLVLFVSLIIIVGCTKNKPHTISESVEQCIKSKLDKEMVLDNVNIIKVDSITQYKEMVNEIRFLTVELEKQKQILELSNKILLIEDSLPFYKGKVWWEIDTRTEILEISKSSIIRYNNIIKEFSKRLDFLQSKVAESDKIAKNPAALLDKNMKQKIIDNKKLLYYLVHSSFTIKPDKHYQYKFKVSKDFEILD